MANWNLLKQFDIGDRVFSHYVMDWGTVTRVHQTEPPTRHGVTGELLPASTWYSVRFDKGGNEMLDDAAGRWDLARIMPPTIAARYGYGNDPLEGRCPECGHSAIARNDDPKRTYHPEAFPPYVCEACERLLSGLEIE